MAGSLADGKRMKIVSSTSSCWFYFSFLELFAKGAEWGGEERRKVKGGRRWCVAAGWKCICPAVLVLLWFSGLPCG